MPVTKDHEYKWELTLQRLPAFQQYGLAVAWNDDELPLTSGDPPSCDALAWLLTDIVTGEDADVEAVPEWMCTDLQARAWPGA